MQSLNSGAAKVGQSWGKGWSTDEEATVNSK
jgi:hypothetical protein